jgi:hypothetical protein
MQSRIPGLHPVTFERLAHETSVRLRQYSELLITCDAQHVNKHVFRQSRLKFAGVYPVAVERVAGEIPYALQIYHIAYDQACL